jgi:TrmH family RNA methyltransferase
VGDPQPPEPASVIRSPDNRTIKLARSLHHRDARWSERAFLVEGFRAIADAIASGAKPRVVLVQEGREREARARLPSDLPMRVVAEPLFARLSDTVTPQGILAVFPFPDLPISETVPPLIVVLDRLQDPGNVGTLIRSAAGAGATAVVFTHETVDPYNPKAVRAAMGAHFRVPLRWETDADVQRLLVSCANRVVADARAELCYDDVRWTEGSAIIIGSEAHGPSIRGKDFANMRARIPLLAGMESLNAAVAGAVFLFEAARQRRRAGVLPWGRETLPVTKGGKLD